MNRYEVMYSENLMPEEFLWEHPLFLDMIMIHTHF